MDELATLLRQMWAGESASANGYFRVKDLVLEMPAPRPRIPIYLGVSGAKGLRQAGRMADGVLLVGFQTPECVRWAVEQIHSGAADAGRQASAIDVAMILWGFQIAADPAVRIAALKPMIAFLLGLPSYYETLLTRGGLDAGILKPLRKALKVDEIIAEGKEPYQHMMTVGDLPAAVRLISDDMIRAMCVLGSEAECERRLQEYKRAGLTHLVLNHGMTYGFPIGQDLQTSLRYLERLRSWWSS
jgi:alkanesulfonate monooxygenase SsuD/methylene tetrahydromethanopterin reductase-like flavin-dependent oxidoreductase (luciferase family)